jgi:exoribonuclease R
MKEGKHGVARIDQRPSIASEVMIQPCRNCGKHGGQAIHEDWDAVCLHCGQLLWLRPGGVTDCKVARLTRFGIIVELGDGVEGLVHVTELADHAVRHPEDVVGVGTLIRAKVLRVDVSERRIGLSRKRVAP